MKRVVIHPAAEAELEQAAAYYEQQRAGLARDFRIEFENALGRLLANPQAYAAELDQMRACRLRRFPFTLHYVELEDRIWLAAVAHQRRRPDYWQTRRPNEAQ